MSCKKGETTLHLVFVISRLLCFSRTCWVAAHIYITWSFKNLNHLYFTMRFDLWDALHDNQNTCFEDFLSAWGSLNKCLGSINNWMSHIPLLNTKDYYSTLKYHSYEVWHNHTIYKTQNHDISHFRGVPSPILRVWW